MEHGRQWAGSGSEWQWCNQCLAYEHTSGLVPGWWVSDLQVPEADLRHDPAPIEAARQDALKRAAGAGGPTLPDESGKRRVPEVESGSDT